MGTHVRTFTARFAAALLMPRSAVLELVKQNQNALMMAPVFGVSPEAMNYRLENLRLAAGTR
jgi:Zn-dependent peptidase ImmA (M78 family)